MNDDPKEPIGVMIGLYILKGIDILIITIILISYAKNKKFHSYPLDISCIICVCCLVINCFSMYSYDIIQDNSFVCNLITYLTTIFTTLIPLWCCNISLIVMLNYLIGSEVIGHKKTIKIIFFSTCLFLIACGIILIHDSKIGFKQNFDFFCTIPDMRDDDNLEQHRFLVFYFVVILFLVLFNCAQIIITYILLMYDEGIYGLLRYKFLYLFFILPLLFYTIDILCKFNLVENRILKYVNLFLKEMMGTSFALTYGFRKTFNVGVSKYVKIIKNYVSKSDDNLEKLKKNLSPDERQQSFESESEKDKTDSKERNFSLSDA